MTGYIYATERYKMEQEFKQYAEVFRAAGMSEDKIEAWHRFLLDELNSNRRFQIHTISYDSLQFSDGNMGDEAQSPLMKDYLEEFSAPQVEISEWGYMAWLDDIDTPEIVEWLRTLGEEDILLFTLIIVDGMKQTEAAKILKKHNSAISRKMKGFREKLAKVLPEHIRREYIR